MKAVATEDNDQSTATEDALRRAVDTTPAFIHTARPDGYLDYFNRGWLDFLGKSLEEVCGWRWTESVHPEDVATLVQKWHAALASGEPFEVESRVRRADGTYRAFLHRKVPLRDEHGNIAKWFGSSVDIEDRKCAERKIAEKTSELERSEFYLREGERLAHMGSWSLRADGIFDYWSPETFVNFGFDPNQGIPTLSQWLDVLYPDDRRVLADLIQRMFSEGVNGDVQYRVRHPKNGQRTMHSTGEPVFENGKVVRLIGNTLDTTEQENAAQELQTSEFYLREGERLAHMGSWSLRADGIFDYWSPETFVLFGFDSSESIPTLPKWLTVLHPDDRDLLAKTLERIFREGVRIDVTYRVDHPKQGKRIMHSTGEPVVENGKVTRLIGNTLDITEQENAAQELPKTELYLREAERLAHMGSWSLRPDGTFDYWSPETFVLFGFDPSEGIPTLPKWLTVLHPDDRDLVAKTLERIFRESVRIDVTYRVDHPKQGKRIMHSTGEPVAEDGKVTRLIGNTLDITEQENAIRDLKKAFGEIRALKDELYKENIVLRHEIGSTSMFEEVLGTSSALQNVLALAAKVAPTDSSVLIAGETGTGKELIARAIHKRSKRGERSFVGVNCAAIPSSLIMSELFGHEKGAFTGATQRRLGRFELAEGGSLFLAEGVDLTLETQIPRLSVLH